MPPNLLHTQMIFILISFVIFSSISCKKYPEEPFDARFTNNVYEIIGFWDIESVVVNGIDSTENFKLNNILSFMLIRYITQDNPIDKILPLPLVYQIDFQNTFD